jgi:GNAT superfamily N-acetyltransferase
MLDVKPIDTKTRQDVINFITENWGSPIIVSKGKIHSAEDLPGFIFIENNKLKGLITYSIENDDCEIVLLESLVENQGIGSILIKKVIEKAEEQKCMRVWLITTNDNTHAIRYYQKRGFNLVGIHLNAVQESRKIKPQIPLYGFDNIPIQHEIEFEKIL